MFLAFDPFTLLLLITVCFFIPGILIAFAVLRNEKLNIVEKTFVGLGLGFVVPPAIPFLSYLIFGIKYTYELALFTVGLFWIIAIALSVWKRADKEITELAGRIKSLDWKKVGILAAIVLLGLLAFWIRFGSYSPVFQELDPYYYTYIPQQIITEGHNPLDDQTAWYPELVVDHRRVPELSYMESLWYSLYNGSNQFDNMLLAVIASFYPPIAAMLSVFLFYLFLSRIMKKEYAMIGAGIASFAPTFIFKLMAGEQEVQPYAFFALPFFYALYILMIQEKKRIFAFLSGIAFFALSLGCSSELLAVTSLIFFWAIYGLFMFLKNAKQDEILKLLELNGIALGLGVFGGFIAKSLFYTGGFTLYGVVSAVITFVILGALYGMNLVLPKITIDRRLIVGVALLVMFIFLISPIGEPIKQIGRSGFQAAQYNSPLYRTIAEQAPAGKDLSTSMGFVALDYTGIVQDVFSPLTALLSSSSEAMEALSGFYEILGTGLSWLFIPFWFITNLMNNIAVSVINFVLGSDVEYVWKNNTLLMVWPIMLILAAAYWLYRNKDGEHSLLAPGLFLIIAIFPPFLVGIIKAKYTIYAAYLIGGGIAFILSEADNYLTKMLKGMENLAVIPLAIGIFLLLMQFVHGGFAPSLAVVNFETRFQDNPDAAQEKLEMLCDDTGNSKICSAAADPVAYANKGTNYQYDRELCVITSLPDYSIYVDSDKSPGLFQAAVLRCNRVDTYWIESMEWIRYNTEDDSRTTSWWDYGHWINFFGQKDTVLRNEHRSHSMIGSIAYSYIDGSPEDLIHYMNRYGSEYALFDGELLVSGGGFGGKYGALNYLSCAFMNETNVSYRPGESQCEADHLWEIVFVSPTDTCVISELSGTVGLVTYTVEIGPPNGEWYYSPYYPAACTGGSYDANTQAFCQYYVHLVPTYCTGNLELADGQLITGTYYLNETYPNGDLKLNKGIPSYPFAMQNTYHFGENQMTGFTMLYTKDKIWMENGEVVDGYEDRKGKFYDSNLYKGFMLGEIEGFDKVFETSESYVKIYKISE